MFKHKIVWAPPLAPPALWPRRRIARDGLGPLGTRLLALLPSQRQEDTQNKGRGRTTIGWSPSIFMGKVAYFDCVEAYLPPVKLQCLAQHRPATPKSKHIHGSGNMYQKI